ncbi:polysaccharide lyase family 3 protein [Atractiella rhizophila]|nr:polysaccharide lyase family 3 protein [Atractiella rhizophila]
MMFNSQTAAATLAYFALTVSATPLEKRTASSTFPTPPTTSHLSAPITVAAGTTFTPPTAYTRYDRGSGACNGQAEGGDSDAVFLIEQGGTLSRVVIGADQSEGVHCLGDCTLDHVYFEDVCEDAITIKGSGTSRINYGGVIVQHNGAGTVIINSFYAEDFGKVYRSCGNCGTQHTRHVEINDGWCSVVAGINTNYGDTAKIRTTSVDDVTTICQKYEPTKNGSGPDSTYCLYSTSDITNL